MKDCGWLQYDSKLAATPARPEGSKKQFYITERPRHKLK